MEYVVFDSVGNEFLVNADECLVNQWPLLIFKLNSVITGVFNNPQAAAVMVDEESGNT